jgi:hypothetical protein
LDDVATQSTSLFRKEGEVWTIAFDGHVCHVPDARGLHYLALLLQRPGVAVPSVELIAAAACRRGDPGANGNGGNEVRERARLTVTKGIRAALRKIEEVHPALARHLEATIKRGYDCRYLPDPRLPIRWQA